jgi:hypothetical protein
MKHLGVVAVAILAGFIGSDGDPFGKLVPSDVRPLFRQFFRGTLELAKRSAEAARTAEKLIATIELRLCELHELKARGRKVSDLIERYESMLVLQP